MIDNILNKAHEIMVNILLIPLFIYMYGAHLYESAQIKYRGMDDKLFLKRWNFLDQEHFDDYMVWTKMYKDHRNGEHVNHLAICSTCFMVNECEYCGESK